MWQKSHRILLPNNFSRAQEEQESVPMFLPFASNTPKEQPGLQGITGSSGQEGRTQPAPPQPLVLTPMPDRQQLLNLSGCSDPEKEMHAVTQLSYNIPLMCECLEIESKPHTTQIAATKFKTTSLFCCPLLFRNAITMCAKEAVEIIHKKAR